MSHLTGLDLHDVAYGFAEPPEHLGGCAPCRAGLASIESERRALERVFREPPARRRPPNWTWAAAGLFLVILGFILRPGKEAAVPTGQERKQEETLVALVERFVNGDETARPKILAAGPVAMHELIVHRRDPRVRALREEIRRAAEAPESETVLLDPTLGVLERPVGGRDEVEEYSEKLGADFAYRYGVILVAKPERLWPREIRVVPLADADRARAKALIARLGVDSADERDAAQKDLRAMGEAVIPVLEEEGARSGDPEIAGRCRTLAESLRPRPTGCFGTPAAASSPDYPAWKDRMMTIKLQDIVLSGVFKLILVGQGKVLEGVPDTRVSLSYENVSSAAILAVTTQAYGLDFVLEDGAPVIGPAEEIRKRVK